MKILLKKIIRTVSSPFVLPSYLKFINTKGEKRFSAKISDFYPQIKDKTIKTGFDRHYVYHTAWAARILKETSPEKHIDIGSSLFFSSIVSAFIPVEFYDLRKAELELSNFESKEGNLLSLPFEDRSVKSLSCMHTIEHIGLGRYGDEIDPNGDIKAAKELSRVLAKDGSLLIVLPVGKPKIEFNAHRIYSYEQVIKLFSELKLKEFSLIKEHVGSIIKNANPDDVTPESYACGCFLFTRE